MAGPHVWNPADEAGGVCTCGHGLYHEVHFGGSRAQAGKALAEDKERTRDIEETKRETTVATPVRISDSHPVYPGRRGIVTHVEDRMCQVQLAPSGDAPVVLPMGFPWRYIDVLPLVVPTFSSPEEADEWLERHNPVITAEPAVPRFSSIEEADAWTEEQRLKKVRREVGQIIKGARPGGPPPPGQYPIPLVNGVRMGGAMEPQEIAARRAMQVTSRMVPPGELFSLKLQGDLPVLKKGDSINITSTVTWDG